MNKRLRLAVVASVVVGTLAGAFYYGWQRRSSVVHEFDWGANVSGTGVLNAIEGVDTSEVAQRRFSYYTGARADGAHPRLSPPTRVLAQAVDGPVSVRLLAFDGHERVRARDEALEIARIASAATTKIFPAPPTPVEIDVHFMPHDTQFSLARRVEWRDGRAYILAIFMRETGFSPATAAHELHHVLALRYALHQTPAARRRPNAARSYEEAAAELFATCGELLARGSLAREERPNARVVTPNRTFEGVLAGAELAAALDLIAGDTLAASLFGEPLSLTVLDDVFGDATVIALDSPQAASLLALCKKTAGNPLALDAWIAGLAPTASAAAPAL